MQFQVPQFIEVEDKLIGPLTFKQFLYVLGGGGMCFLLWRLLPTFLAIIAIIPVGAFALALAFYTVNERPFINVLESGIKFYFRDKLYIWKKKQETSSEFRVPSKNDGNKQEITVPRFTEGKLKDIAWSLDVHKKIK